MSGPSGCGPRTARSPDAGPRRSHRSATPAPGIGRSGHDRRAAGDRRRQRGTRPGRHLDLDDHADPVHDRGPPGDDDQGDVLEPRRPRRAAGPRLRPDRHPGHVHGRRDAGDRQPARHDLEGLESRPDDGHDQDAERWRSSATRPSGSQRDRRDHRLGGPARDLHLDGECLSRAGLQGPVQRSRPAERGRHAHAPAHTDADTDADRRRPRSRRRPPTPTADPDAPAAADPPATVDPDRRDRRRPRSSRPRRRRARPRLRRRPGRPSRRRPRRRPERRARRAPVRHLAREAARAPIRRPEPRPPWGPPS